MAYNSKFTGKEVDDLLTKVAQPSVVTFNATIPVSSWNNQTPSVATVTVSGILSTDTPVVDLVPSSTYATAEQQIEAYSLIYRMTTGTNTITAYATKTPSVNIPIQIMAVRK